MKRKQAHAKRAFPRAHSVTRTHIHTHTHTHTQRRHHPTGTWGNATYSKDTHTWTGECTPCTPIAHASNPNNTITCTSDSDSKPGDGFVCDYGFLLAAGECQRMSIG